VQPWESYMWQTRGSVGRRVRDSVIPTEAAAVDKAQAALWAVAERMWEGAELHQQKREMVDKLFPPSDHPRFVVDVNSGPALWMQWAASPPVRRAAKQQRQTIKPCSIARVQAPAAVVGVLHVLLLHLFSINWQRPLAPAAT